MRARISDILAHAEQLSGVPVETIRGNSRKAHYVRLRQAVWLIAREQTYPDGELIQRAYSFPQIGAMFGRDHSTVIHGAEKAEQMAARDPVYGEFVCALREAAQTGGIFAGKSLPAQIPVTHNPPPVKSRAKVPHIKAVTLAPGEMPDEAHKFHTRISMGSDLLTAALAKALAKALAA